LHASIQPHSGDLFVARVERSETLVGDAGYCASAHNSNRFWHTGIGRKGWMEMGMTGMTGMTGEGSKERANIEKIPSKIEIENSQ